MRLSLLASLVLLLTASASAQIATDRPGFGFSPALVDRGTFQLEAGLPEVGHDGPLTVFSFPVQLRYGLTEAVELRLGSSVYDIVRASGGGQSFTDGDLGFDVIEVGAKIQLASNGPVIALLPSVSIPTREGIDLSGAARVIAGWTLTDQFSLTTVLGASLTDSDPDTQVRGEATAVIATSLMDALSAYAELAAFPGDDDTPVYGGGGLTLLLAPNVQIDTFVDLGLTDSATDVIVGGGASFRF